MAEESAALSDIPKKEQIGEGQIKRVYLHLALGDAQSAIEEARKHLQENPHSSSLQLALIYALCAHGDEMEALGQWRLLIEKHPEYLEKRELLEALAWSVLEKGETSNQLAIRLNALVGSGMTRDVKALPLILKGLKGSNSLIRAVCANLATSYGDLPLQEEMVRLLKEEKVWHVRLELIKGIGQLKILAGKEELFRILANPKMLTEERAAAIVAVVEMLDHVEDQELKSLLSSNRAGLRELGCQIISHLGLKKWADELLVLLKDPHPYVKIAALNTFILLGIEKIKDAPLTHCIELQRLLEDPDKTVAITAAWVCCVQGEKIGKEKLSSWILGKEPSYARLASAALAASGSQGKELCEELLEKTQDPYVKMNLAFGLIGQRVSVEKACNVLNTQLKRVKELWMWDNSINPLFRSLAPSDVRYTSQIPNTPQVVDHLTRLEVLRVLCMLEHPGAKDAVKEFLQTKTLEVIGPAALTLVQEGDEEVLDVIRLLLQDPSEKVKIQAALVLTLFGSDQEALELLKKAYGKADRELKIAILEAVARAKDRESLSFLLERLDEPFQILRVIAATALIQSIYH